MTFVSRKRHLEQLSTWVGCNRRWQLHLFQPHFIKALWKNNLGGLEGEKPLDPNELWVHSDCKPFHYRNNIWTLGCWQFVLLNAAIGMKHGTSTRQSSSVILEASVKKLKHNQICNLEESAGLDSVACSSAPQFISNQSGLVTGLKRASGGESYWINIWLSITVK